MFLLDHSPQKHTRPNDRHLTFDHRIINAAITQERFRPGDLFFARIEKNLSGGRIQWNFSRGVDSSNDQYRNEDRGYEFPLAPTEMYNFPQIEATFGLILSEGSATC